MAASAIILGAGPAGLACAAALKDRGIAPAILEKERAVAPVWRRHYDRLHLHTDRSHSGLPGLPMPRSCPKYAPRKDVIAYFESYADHHGLAPEFGCTVESVRRNRGWEVHTSAGTRHADAVVVALGMASFPFQPDWPGLDSFAGDVLHSSAYRNPGAFAGKRVLVVGFGNSGGEIAMDLADHGIDVALSVRSPVNVVPRDILGIPILTLTILMQALPYRVADVINGPILRLFVGDIRKLGLRRAGKGPMAQVVEDGRIPLLDIGTLDRIRRGKISVRPDVDRVDGRAVRFNDGTDEEVDAIIFATGFRPDLRALLPENPEVLSDRGAPKTSGEDSGADGLYFCSYRVSPTGQLREIGIEAERIARSVAERFGRT